MQCVSDGWSPLQRDVAKANEKWPQLFPPDWTCTSNASIFDYNVLLSVLYAKSEIPLAMSLSMCASTRATG